MARIYVASSWRNPFYPDVASRFKDEGHDVYDVRNPPYGGKLIPLDCLDWIIRNARVPSR